MEVINIKYINFKTKIRNPRKAGQDYLEEDG
jgi:hypothetical protein